MSKFTMNKKYKNNTCIFCNGELVPIIIIRPEISKMMCSKCGAIYYNVNDHESGHPGEFTGRYGPVSVDRRYEDAWGSGQEPIVNKEEDNNNK